MKRPMCSQKDLITPVTKSIYEPGAKKVFAQLDDRLLWWVWSADSHKHGMENIHRMLSDSRFKELDEQWSRQRRMLSRDMAKDIWFQQNSFYAKSSTKKNGKPKFESNKPVQNWIMPDVKSNLSRRIFYRSAANARAYNYKRMK